MTMNWFTPINMAESVVGVSVISRERTLIELRIKLGDLKLGNKSSLLTYFFLQSSGYIIKKIKAKKEKKSGT